jgi:hypothetical protein
MDKSLPFFYFLPSADAFIRLFIIPLPFVSCLSKKIMEFLRTLFRNECHKCDLTNLMEGLSLKKARWFPTAAAQVRFLVMSC